MHLALHSASLCQRFVKSEQIDSIYSDMLKRGLSPRSVQVAHRSLHGALKQAVAWELIGRNVLGAVRVPKQRKPEIAFWTSDELLRFLAFAEPHRLHALFYTALATGMRRGELVVLRWSDADLVRERITVTLNAVAVNGKTLVKEPKSQASRRTVFIQDGDVAVLKAHREQLARERHLLGLDSIRKLPCHKECERKRVAPELASWRFS